MAISGEIFYLLRCKKVDFSQKSGTSYQIFTTNIDTLGIFFQRLKIACVLALVKV